MNPNTSSTTPSGEGADFLPAPGSPLKLLKANLGGPKGDRLLAALGLVLIVLVFSRGVTREFFWDDELLVRSASGLGSFLDAFRFDSFGLSNTDGRIRYYRPLATLSFALELRFFGTSALVSHFTNLVLHICNARLAFRFLERHLGDSFRRHALLLATLWAVVPIHGEVVSWISARGDLLGCFFVLLGTQLVAKCSRVRNAALLSLGFATAATLSKEAYIIAPFFFAAEFQRRGGNQSMRNAFLVGALSALPLAGYAVFRAFGPGLGGGQAVVIAALPLIDRIALIFETIGYALATLVVPFRAELLRGSIGYIDPLGLQTEPFWGGIGLIGTLLAAVLFLQLRSLRRSLSLLAIASLPFLNIMPTGMESRMSDRYAYLPFLALLLVVGSVTLPYAKSKWTTFVLAAALGLAAPLAAHRAYQFGHPITLVRSELESHRPPHSVFTIAAHLYSEEGDLLGARDVFLGALARQTELGMPPFFRDALMAALLQIRINGQQLPKERTRGIELIECLLAARAETRGLMMLPGNGALHFPCAAPEIQEQIGPLRHLLEATLLSFRAEAGDLTRQEVERASASCPKCISQKKTLALASLALLEPDLAQSLLRDEIAFGSSRFARGIREAADAQTQLLKRPSPDRERQALFLGGAFLQLCSRPRPEASGDALVRASCSLGGAAEDPKYAFSSELSVALRTNPQSRLEWLRDHYPQTAAK